MFSRKPFSAGILMALIPAALLLLGSMACNLFEPSSAVDLSPFQELAQTSGCSDVRNRLFLIDDQMVFWDRTGNCADASYGETLYGSTPEQMLCNAHDSIAGPMKNCADERYQDLFNTILTNLDKPDLGLGAAHTVQPVPIWLLFW